MRGHIRKRGSASFEYIVDVGTAPAQHCEVCNKRFWLERKPKDSCPGCSGKLVETDELDTYSHAIPAMQEEAAERIAELVSGES